MSDVKKIATKARFTYINKRLPFREGFIFTELRENKVLANFSELTIFSSSLYERKFNGLQYLI